MKKIIALFTVLSFLLIGNYSINAQSDSLTDTNITETMDSSEEMSTTYEPAAEVVESASFHQIIKQKFIEGGPGFMGIVLLCLILGLALAIERIIYLNMATTDTDKLLAGVENAMQNGGIDAAKEVCRNTKGPVASIFYQGLDRANEGIDMVEKSIISYGSVQMGLLEKGLSWISLFIALAPMLGFMGTVIGMIGAFDAIEAAGDISLSFLLIGNYSINAQSDSLTDTNITETMDSSEEMSTTYEPAAEVVESASFHQIIKQKFIEGGPGFMGIVLLCLILGLALAIERIIYLNMATTDTDKLLAGVENAMQNGGIDAAKEVCRNTKGPVASIFYQGLDRANEGIDMVEKSIISYGSVQMGLLEKGLSWISLFIALAPMLGFMGTVIGMIGAFDAIEAAGDISPSLVAGGIKVALLTTVFGLIVAMILQVFYNYLISKVDSITNSMEDASISLIDLLVKNK